VQYVNTADNGREIQSAFFTGSNPSLNPTEAGDGIQPPVIAMHGSVNTLASNSGSTQSTRAIPNEFDTSSFISNSANEFIAYLGMLLGKNITLNYNSMGPVAQYTTVIQLPNAISNGTLELPTGYMPSQFTRFWTYDATSNTLTDVSSAVPDDCNANTGPDGYEPSSGYGGVIISTQDSSSAMGIYNSTTAVGGPVDYFALWNFPCDGTSKWDNVRSNRAFPAGQSTFTSYIATGTVAQVQSDMYQLKNGVPLPTPSPSPSPKPTPTKTPNPNPTIKPCTSVKTRDQKSQVTCPLGTSS
jgi:hypothetical protein